MSLADKLKNVEPITNKSRCAVCFTLSQLSEADASALNDALKIPVDSPSRITDRQISEVLKSEGHDVSSNSVYRHRQNHLEK